MNKTEVLFPYGKEKIRYDFNPQELIGDLTSQIEAYQPESGERELVSQALRHPIGPKRLSEQLSIVAIPDGVSVMVTK